MQNEPQYDVLVMGIGNILWADEGFGVRAVERFHEKFADDPCVRVIDGGTLADVGSHFLHVADAVKGGDVGRVGDDRDGDGVGVGAGGDGVVDFDAEGEGVGVIGGIGVGGVFGLSGSSVGGGKSRISSTSSRAFSEAIAPSVISKVIERGSGSGGDGLGGVRVETF